ncbi:MAG: hypothetical protein H0X37_00975 [Herpetosiphonaceae bacterium]|nr:hypothetical protein [Herpetosiphonaceae bacterium]
MSIPQNADRARNRYAAVLYRSALLRDPDATRAGQAIITAWSHLDWDILPLDDQIELRLIAALPPIPRFRWKRRASFAPIPASFWTLSPPTRLALGLRLLRGMGSPAIARALNLSLLETQNLLLDGLLRSSGITCSSDLECRHCMLARLDDASGERAHLLNCAHCRETIPQLERYEAELAQQLGRAVGSIGLPHAVDDALVATFRTTGSGKRGEAPLWQRPFVWQVTTVGLVVLGLALLFRSHTNRPAVSVMLGDRVASAKVIIDDARRQYDTVPVVSGILHRRWAINLDRPQLSLQADEWVDPQQPGRHRMQLMTDQNTREWQVGDGAEELRYVSSLAPWFCGIVPPGVDIHNSQQNIWHIAAQEQAEMRQARWHHGPWAIGLQYLDLAAAGQLRSLGTAGDGSDAALTISAEGPAIDGTLLLRFDPVSHALKEVRQLRTNNGQTEERVPWRLVLNATIDRDQAQQTGILIRYPGDALPDSVQRALPIIDRACPLTGPEQAQSLPRLLASQGQASGQLWGLPTLPLGIDRAMIIGPGDPANPGNHGGPGASDLNTMRIVYIGATKRLVLMPGGQQFGINQPAQTGPWQISFFPSGMPTILRGTLQHTSTVQLGRGFGQRNGIRVQAEGWTKEELLPLLASVRPLSLEDWARSPDRFYEPVPLDPTLRERLLHIINASQPQAERIHHRVVLTTTRQNPAEVTLTDPYHLPTGKWPPVRRVESWSEVDPTSGTTLRWREVSTDTQGRSLTAEWNDGQVLHSYTAVSNSVITETASSAISAPLNPAADLLRNTDWQWTTQADGTLIAEHAQVLPWQGFDGLYQPWTLDDWTTDLGLRHGIERLIFNADGTLQAREILAAPRTNAQSAPVTTVLVHREVVLQDEWLPTASDASFTWNADPGAVEIGRFALDSLSTPQALGPQPHSLEEAAAAVPFPIWAWSRNNSTFAGPASNVPSQFANDEPLLGRASIEQALNLGVAVQLRYDLPYGPLELLEGPSPVLRRLLQQTAPRWTTSEPRQVTIHGQSHELWIMDGKSSNNSWLVFELDQTLFFMHFGGPPADVQAVIDHLGDLQVVTPSQHT